MTDAHSKFSASSSHRWMTCPGSMVLESTQPNSSSSYADEGSAAHWVASEVLLGKLTLADAVGQDWWPSEGGKAVRITQDMCAHVQTYIDTVKTYGGELLVEQRVHYHNWLGCKKDEAFGTSDAVIMDGDLITIVDLKFGMGVRVFAEENPQLMLYALGALYEFEMLGDFKRARMVISQPRLGHHDEWECDVAEIHAFAARAKAAVAEVQSAGKLEALALYSKLHVDEEACRFCKAKAVCPALAAEVREVVTLGSENIVDDFDSLTEDTIASAPDLSDDELRQKMAAVPLLEMFSTAVRAEMERRLFAGGDPQSLGFKLVEGKRGNRAWSDCEAALEAMKSMRLKHEDIYSYSLNGPAPMEKLLKKENPRRWATLQALIVQPEGRPHVAPVSDRRPALSITPTADDFDDVSEAPSADAHPFRS